MPTTVNVLGLGPVNFPDGMTHDEIIAALKKIAPPPSSGSAASSAPGVLAQPKSSPTNLDLPSNSAQLAADIEAGRPVSTIPLSPSAWLAAAIEAGTITASKPTPGVIAQPKSLGGFAQNVVNSGERLIANTAEPILHPINTAEALVSAVKHPGVVARAVGQSLKQRYGSLPAIENTLYTDPVGVAADLSTVLGGAGALAKGAGAVGDLAGAADVADAARVTGRVLSTASDATNPIGVIARAAEPITEYGTAAAVRPFLRPAKRLIRQQDSPLEIERTALTSGAVTKGLAERMGKRAGQEATQIADQATQAGKTIPRPGVVAFPRTLDTAIKTTPNTQALDDLANLESETNATLPASITPTEGLQRRRQLDRDLNQVWRGAERGGPQPGIREFGRQEIANNLRGQLRTAAPAIRTADDKARRLMLVEQALQDAGDRRGTIPMSALEAGFGAAAYNPEYGLPAGAAVALGRNVPEIPLALGTVPVGLSRLMASHGGATAGLASDELSRLLLEQALGSQQTTATP